MICDPYPTLELSNVFVNVQFETLEKGLGSKVCIGTAFDAISMLLSINMLLNQL